MQVQTWDAVFIRATRRRLHPVIAEVTSWPHWELYQQRERCLTAARRDDGV